MSHQVYKIIIYNKNSLCNFYHQHLHRLLFQQLCDVANMCLAIICVWRLASVHCINCLSDTNSDGATLGLYHTLSQELIHSFIHMNDHTHGHIYTAHTHTHTHKQHTYTHSYTVTDMHIYILNFSVKASSKGLVATITH